ncbi:MAG: chemotaxis protein CheC [Solirubrobacteraceae bacterium]|nr:chemotaxis protein CheC [Solirubrobacteraceae bacterium]
MTPRLNDMQLDALRELANIASGTAATALGQMLGQEVGLSVPVALALPLADAVDACGTAESLVSGVVIPLEGDIEGLVLLLIPADHAAKLCELLGVQAGSDVGDSALCEIGNILGTAYLNGLSAMTGMSLGPRPPHLTTDMLGAIVASLLAQTSGDSDAVLVLDSELDLQNDPCSITFLLLPSSGGVTGLLAPLGLAEME